MTTELDIDMDVEITETSAQPREAREGRALATGGTTAGSATKTEAGGPHVVMLNRCFDSVGLARHVAENDFKSLTKPGIAALYVCEILEKFLPGQQQPAEGPFLGPSQRLRNNLDALQRGLDHDLQHINPAHVVSGDAQHVKFCIELLDTVLQASSEGAPAGSTRSRKPQRSAEEDLDDLQQFVGGQDRKAGTRPTPAGPGSAARPRTAVPGSAGKRGSAPASAGRRPATAGAGAGAGAGTRERKGDAVDTDEAGDDDGGALDADAAVEQARRRRESRRAAIEQTERARLATGGSVRPPGATHEREVRGLQQHVRHLRKTVDRLKSSHYDSALRMAEQHESLLLAKRRREEKRMYKTLVRVMEAERGARVFQQARKVDQVEEELIRSSVRRRWWEEREMEHQYKETVSRLREDRRDAARILRDELRRIEGKLRAHDDARVNFYRNEYDMFKEAQQQHNHDQRLRIKGEQQQVRQLRKDVRVARRDALEAAKHKLSHQDEIYRLALRSQHAHTRSPHGKATAGDCWCNDPHPHDRNHVHGVASSRGSPSRSAGAAGAGAGTGAGSRPASAVRGGRS